MKFLGFIKAHKKFSVKMLILSILVIVLILFICLKLNSDIAEGWTQTYVKFHAFIFGNVTKYIPFSLTELFFFGLFVLFTVFFVLMIINLVQKKRRKALHCVINITLAIMATVTVYQATAEMAYNRHTVDIPLYQEKVNKESYIPIIQHFMDDLSVCCDNLTFRDDGEIVEPYDLNTMNNLIAEEFKKYPSNYLFEFTTNVKPMATSFIYREYHITGVTFLPLGEANINYLNVAAGKPFTYIHELAHTKGAMREADADLVAAYISLNSDNYYIRYSGYYYTIGSLMALAKYTGNESDYQTLVEALDPRFLKNLDYNNPYWKSHSAGVNFANWVNDIYLKMSGQAEGTNSYGDSTIVIDKDTHEIITFSSYQKLYFKIFYS